MPPCRAGAAGPKMQRLLMLAAALLACTAASATELVRVRVSQFDGSEPAALSSASHPQLFALDPSIAFAELVATNPADPRKEDHGPARWLPVMTPSPGLSLTYGVIELRITPASGQAVAFGVLHFRTEALVASNPSFFELSGSHYPDFQVIPGISLRSAATRTFLLEAPASDAVTSFRWSTAGFMTGMPGGPAGFSGVDLVVSSPLCEAAPREACEEATRSAVSQKVDRRRGWWLDWSWNARGAAFEPLGGVDAAPLFAFCLYDDDERLSSTPFGPDLCGEASCWKEGRRSFRYRSLDRCGVMKLRSRQTERGVAGSLAAAIPPQGTPPFALGLPLPPGEYRAQLVRSDAGCFEASFTLP